VAFFGLNEHVSVLLCFLFVLTTAEKKKNGRPVLRAPLPSVASFSFFLLFRYPFRSFCRCTRMCLRVKLLTRCVCARVHCFLYIFPLHYNCNCGLIGTGTQRAPSYTYILYTHGCGVLQAWPALTSPHVFFCFHFPVSRVARLFNRFIRTSCSLSISGSEEASAGKES
jgi:hypothetical protein